ncbi:histidine kinase N-terminal 7TM domain-containing protein, partial [Natronomonas sp.]|uniref:histidine kinase N-terminal 7TM domain-containing protein n=1 Tax=Natronomonas sp. TaxID=2184060 RepID=UPI002FC2F8A0
MEFQFSVYLVPLAAAAVLSAVLAVVVFRGRNKRTAPQIFAVLVATVLWAAADALRLAVLDSTAALVLHNVRFLGSTLVVIAIFLHAMEYTGRGDLLTRRSVAGLSAVLVVTNVLVWAEIPLAHGLIYAGFEPTQVGSITVFEVAFGPWFYLNAAYSYLLLLVAMAMYVTEFLRRRGTFRRQTGGLLVGMTVPWVMNAVYLAGFSPIDLTAFGFTVTAVALVAQLYWFHLLDVVPIARSTVVEHIESSYLVLDHENRVLDANEAAATLFDTPQDAMIGTPVADLLADCPGVYEEFEDVRETREDITILQGEERRDYDVGISPIYDGHDQYLGRVVLIRDVTDQRRSQRQLEARTKALERRNEKLDQFASLVSHDLRNPIAVAKGHLEIAREEDAPESFDHVEKALDRMETIAEDVLDLARQEREHTDVAPVDLEALCKGAWGTVETHDATLVVEPTADVLADENRLRQALENLFRNAVEHGSTSP